MLLIMAVSLYTSRVTLSILGVDDFGIYQTVGGTVTFLAFLSNALATGTSRFITYEMGSEKKAQEKLFATVRVAHIILGLSIVIAGEIAGLWFLYNKLVIPADRLDAAVFAFHFSMAATFFQITQVPYNATIIAHERMNIFAYISILEAVLKLAIVYVLLVFSHDKLEIYAVLMCMVTVMVLCIYRVYCRRTFEETRTGLLFDKGLFGGVASFSSWSLLSSLASSLANQGITVVTDMFFSPAYVTVRSLALKINEMVNQFIGNFRTAVNPQIVKKYASGDKEGSEELAIASVGFTYYLMLIPVLPLFFLTGPALRLWLEEVPEGLDAFVRIALVQGLFQALDTSLYAPIYAKGHIKENAIISPLFDFIQLPVIYYLFRHGYPPIVLAWVALVAYFVLGVIVKPVLVHVIVKYDYKKIMFIIMRCMAATAFAGLISSAAAYGTDVNTVAGFLMVLLVSVLSVLISVWVIGIDRRMKEMLTGWLKSKPAKK